MKTFLAIYWVAFVAVAAWWGQLPGFNDRPLTYPWLEVTAVSLILAALLLGLYGLLSSSLVPGKWFRLSGALCYSTVIAVVSLNWAGTDWPGYYYALPMFGLSTFVLVLLIVVGASIKALLHKGHVT